MPSYSAILATDGDENISVGGTVATLTLPTALNASARQTKGVTGGRATIRVRTAPILYTLNGTAPTDSDYTTGQELKVGELLVLTSFAEMDNFKAIRATATTAALYVQYERRVN